MVYQETLTRSLYFILTILFGIITYSILNGSLQNYIHFAGVKNEIGTLFFSSMLTIIFFSQTITQIKK